jgi:hypothetical protein
VKREKLSVTGRNDRLHRTYFVVDNMHSIHYSLFTDYLEYRPVALTARASDSKSEGWGFKSLLACHMNEGG